MMLKILRLSKVGSVRVKNRVREDQLLTPAQLRFHQVVRSMSWQLGLGECVGWDSRECRKSEIRLTRQCPLQAPYERLTGDL